MDCDSFEESDENTAGDSFDAVDEGSQFDFDFDEEAVDKVLGLSDSVLANIHNYF